jgi:hypothetical protein
MTGVNSLRSYAICAVSCILIASSAGAEWLCNGTEICTQPNSQGTVCAVADGFGGAIMAWTDYRSGDYDVYAQRVSSSGEVMWEEDGVPVCTEAGGQTSTAIATDGAGGAILVWDDYRYGRLDLFAQRIDSSGTALWTPNAIPICTESGDQWRQDITSDFSGGAIIAWEDRRRDFDSADVYTQRVDAYGNVLWTVGGVFAGTATVFCDPKICPDGAGGAIITWMNEPTGEADVYGQRVNPDGSMAWGADGIPVCDAPGHQHFQCVVADGEGGACVAWEDWADSVGIYAQRIDHAGTRLWVPRGVPVCTAAGTERDARITSDARGGAIVVWSDHRTGSSTSSDIYAQRVDAEGDVAWETNGVLVSGATGFQSYPEITANGAGGGIIAWRDSRDSNYDIYAQQMDSSGTAVWTADGIALCTLTSAQTSPRLAPSGPGVAIVAWTDGRNGSNDIYAQITQDWSGAASGPPAAAADARPHPNPFRISTRIALDPRKCSNLSVGVYDTSGRLVRMLAGGSHDSGARAVVWDGRDGAGRQVASGIYFVRVEAANFRQVSKVVLMR